jgi:hypothetical protein
MRCPLAILALFAFGCGAKSQLIAPPPFVDASIDILARDVVDVSAFDALADTPPDLPALVDAGPDVVPDIPCGDCDDHIPCTIDACDFRTGVCQHAPDDTRCPGGEHCDVALGCTGFVLASTNNTLYRVDPTTGALAVQTHLTTLFFDIAIGPDGRLYGSSGAGAELDVVDVTTGVQTRIGALPDTLHALEFAPSGELYGATNSVYQIDPATGRSTVIPIPGLPPATGDIAFIGTHLYMSADPNDLVEIHLATRTWTRIGTIGTGSTFGLAARAGVLYGFTGSGEVTRIDPVTGRGTVVAIHAGETFHGGSAR